MDRVTADSNIYISAFQFRGKPLDLLTLGAYRKIELAISEHIVAEVTRTLREKFDWPEDGIAQAQRIIARIARRVVPSQTLDAIKEDPSDTASSNAQWRRVLNSSSPANKHLLRLTQHAGIKVVKVGDFLRELQPIREP